MDVPESTRPRLLWITDPWDTLDHPRDTTLRLIDEAVRMGAGSCWADAHSIRWEAGRTWVEAYEVVAVASGRTATSFRLSPLGSQCILEFDCLMYRPDPPVDLAYLHPLQLLLLAGEGDARRGHACRIVNSPRVLLSQSEKMAGTFLPDRMPPTLAASQWDALCRFGNECGLAVVKPLHQCQSKQVELLDFRSPAERDRSRGFLERMTGGFATPVVLQRFLPEIEEGETRVWFLDGCVLAVARKKSADGGYRIDMDKGGVLVPHVLTERETAILPDIGRWLCHHDVRLAAVDLIDGWITDFNFTSPGLIPSMETVTGRNLARPIIEALISPSCVADQKARRDRKLFARTDLSAPA